MNNEKYIFLQVKESREFCVYILNVETEIIIYLFGNYPSQNKMYTKK